MNEENNYRNPPSDENNATFSEYHVLKRNYPKVLPFPSYPGGVYRRANRNKLQLKCD